ncbi:aconitate hydratase [Treponema lecithinolyticum]|uniref:Aconitate hydratase A n=1 Tax=Treponema lecithinolyticum ATCC 700332 TaxID=1321815 RepID=A0ABN0NZT9_TRELE|nr:aconitate hydratase [Treponema lecithinolyticum]ERJ93569.1 putative aconitate hydratase [Treponema lecithinolyticum ATCC 700332]
MALTLTEKIIQNHIVQKACSDTNFVKGKPIPPLSHIALRIDQTLTQDATGTMTYLQFETIGIPRVKTELSVSYIDHNTLQTDFKNMDDHRYLQSAAAKYGLWFSRAGNGICHQVHLEKFGIPGKTLLGSDSHTPTAGGLGMLAIGAGGLDVAVAMAGGAFHLAMPKVIGVRLSGKLRAGVGAKDIILEVLRCESVKGGVGAVYEYFGEGVASLTVPQRATVTNMGAELGATCSIFPSDEATKRYLELMGRVDVWQPLAADEDAVYDKIIDIRLDELTSLAACPHSPDAVQSVASLAGKPVQQVVIGSCTNSSLDDLAQAAAIVKGKHIAEGVEAGIAPGSRNVLLTAAKTGILTDLIEAGFRILESACGPCLGQGFAPCSGGVSLRTFNRNFKGRSGTADAQVYLVSPETAAASAVTGVITEPESIAESRSSLLYASAVRDIIEQTAKNDSMFIAPLSAEEAQHVEIIRGPNIKSCPHAAAVQNRLELPLILKAGDNISTDDILPAGAKMLPLRSNIPAIAEFTLERIDPDFYRNAKQVQSEGKDGCIIVAGENYGQGSSREHAALAPMYLGVRAVLAKSFARIHRANLINYGILPLVFKQNKDYDTLEKGDTLILDGINTVMQNASDFTVLCKKANGTQYSFGVSHGLDKRSRDILLSGGLALYTANGGQ